MLYDCFYIILNYRDRSQSKTEGKLLNTCTDTCIFNCSYSILLNFKKVQHSVFFCHIKFGTVHYLVILYCRKSGNSLYELMGVEKSAPHDEIRKTYRRVSILYVLTKYPVNIEQINIYLICFKQQIPYMIYLCKIDFQFYLEQIEM